MMSSPYRALFCSYDPEIPSFRHRLQPLTDHLEDRGWNCSIQQLPHGGYYRRLWELRSEIEAADVVVLAKINLALGEPALLRRLARRVVLDIDDAVFLRKPRRLGDKPNDSRWRWLKFAGTCKASDLVLAGNHFLAGVARRKARHVEVVPTAIDLSRYPNSPPRGRTGRTLVWIGRPENLVYLEILRPALAALTKQFAGLALRVVCSHFPHWPEIEMEIEKIPWHSQTEVESLSSADIGLMPLTDDGWSRGKCAFKLLQYMAAYLPTVASPVGANRQAVEEGTTGFLATSVEEWQNSLVRLLTSDELRQRFATAGRAHVAEHYNRAAVVARTAAFFTGLVER